MDGKHQPQETPTNRISKLRITVDSLDDADSKDRKTDDNGTDGTAKTSDETNKPKPAAEPVLPKPVIPKPAEPKKQLVPRRPAAAVVAIDVGTAESGFGSSRLNKPNEVVLDQVWSSKLTVSDVMKGKTKTDLLMRASDKTYVEFGVDAFPRFMELAAQYGMAAASKDYLFFKAGFKMQLYPTKNGGELVDHPKLKSITGAEVDAVDVFAACLTALRDKAVERLKDNCVDVMDHRDIRWIVTMPAIWSQGARQLMRMAAEKADLAEPTADSPITGTTELRSHYMTALESEAAALRCRAEENGKLNDDAESDDGTDEDDDEEKKSVSFVVVDAGCGTADFSIHTTRKGRIDDVAIASSGANYGAGQVEAAFMRWFRSEFGSSDIDRISTDPKTVLSLMELEQNFRSLMQAADPADRKYRTMAVPEAFRPLIARRAAAATMPVVDDDDDANVGKPAEDSKADDSKKADVIENELEDNEPIAAAFDASNTVSDGGGPTAIWQWKPDINRLRLNHALIERFFRWPVTKTVMHLLKLLATNESIQTVNVVGGFAESKMLWTAITAAVNDAAPKIRVVRPPNAAHAVLAGAIMFGRNPTSIKARAVRRSFGVLMASAWIEAEHGPAGRRKVVATCRGKQTELVYGLFKPYTTAGDLVEVADKIVKKFSPIMDNQKTLTVDLYASGKPIVQFCTDDGCKRIGGFTLNCPDIGDNFGLNRTFVVELRFGTAEITVTAYEDGSKKATSVVLSFLDAGLAGQASSTAPADVRLS